MDFAYVVQNQRSFFRSGVTRSVPFRLDILHTLRDAIRNREGALSEALRVDLGKSPHEAYASEIGFVLSELDHALRHLKGWAKPRSQRTPLIAWPARGFISPEPYGVALIVGPWNYPFQLLFSPLIGALAAGNCALLKPSEFAPETAATIEALIRDTFEPEYVTVALGARDTAEALLREKFDCIFFTGSTGVGRAVMAAAAQHLTPVTLELGGKSPCLVCADAPIETTARRIAWGKFLNAGQTCVAPDFVWVDRAIRSPLIEALKQELGKFYGLDPKQSRDYGRIIHRRHFDRLTAFLDSGSIAHGGQQHAEELYLAPTLLTEVSWESPVMQEEIFGPILPVLEFDRIDDAIARLRDLPTPLALYLFTRDRGTQSKVLAETRSGGVCINDTITHIVGKHLPLGGLGESGFGAYHGQASFDAFTHRRSVLSRSLTWDPAIRYPPPRASLTTLKRVFRFLMRS